MVQCVECVMNAQIGRALVVANLIMVILHSVFISFWFFHAVFQDKSCPIFFF